MTTSIDNLAAAWASLDAVLARLSDTEWGTPTGCPGWTVQDNVAHLIDYEARALGLDPPPPTVGDPQPHIKNDLGAANEHGVEARRGRAPAEVLAELREVTAARLEQLRGLTGDELSREIDLPVGRGTVADMLRLRVMDTWSHEQDIRRAVGAPGHVDGPVVDEAIGYFCRFLPIVVVKRAGAPDGAAVVFELDGRAPFTVVVAGGRGSLETGLVASPTTVLHMPVTVFGALVCGRTDVSPADVAITGDADLAARVLTSLAFMP